MAAGELRLGLIGLGTVGSGVVRLLAQNADELARKRNCRLRLVHVASRSIHTKPHPNLGDARLSTDPWAVVRDPEVELVVELIGRHRAGPLPAAGRYRGWQDGGDRQ